MSEAESIISATKRFTFVVGLFIVCLILSVAFQLAVIFDLVPSSPDSKAGEMKDREVMYWSPPDPSTIATESDSSLIRYGRELIAHTARYLGPKGKVMQITNGMNCNNCHLDAGTRIFAANYSAVASTYPKFRARSGSIESVEKRINDCFQRSLNGMPLDPESREMKAIIAYFKWLGHNVSKGLSPPGTGFLDLKPMDRMADTVLGKQHYGRHCATCHGSDGEGRKDADEVEWIYPPLWGVNSYNTAAGLMRISRFASFVKSNMPFGTLFDRPVLTDEEAWDIAAFVNSRPRPHRAFAEDWPDISKKPADHPFGPYADDLTEPQHKYGPWPVLKR